MKMKKLSVKALMSLILSAILFCMPIGAFFANRANTVEVHAEDTAEQKTESAAEESSAESTASGNDNKDSSGSGENHTEQSTENTTENSTEGTTEETQPSAKCTCKKKCSQYAVDEDCEVCAKDYKECAYINPSVKITINTPSGWHNDTTKVTVKVEDTVVSGNFTIQKVQAKVGQNGSWTDITEDMYIEISENSTIYVQVTDQKGKTYEKNRYIKCFDFTKPTLNAAISDGLLSIQAHDTDSGIKAIYVNGYEFTEHTNGALNIRLQQFDAGYQYFTISAMDNAGNTSEIYKTANPYYTDPENKDSSEKDPAQQLPVDASATKPSSATAQITEHTKTDVNGNTVSQTGSGTTSSSSATAKQEADWLVGINGTRLFTVLYGGKALKVGRVQTPTLAMLVDRESKIMNFKKEAYYMAHIIGNGLDAVSEHISDKTEAERIAGACENGQALVTSVVKEEKWVAPPKLYDLTTLQRDANRLFGFTAKQTLEYTQSLYEKKLVTYPRTDSQYLSDDMEGTARNVIEAIFNSLLFEQNIMFNPDVKKVLNSKKVTDHHAIIPTMEIVKQDLKAIPESEMKILSLCANRLLCATAEKHIYNSTKAELTCNGMVFKVSGKAIWKNGWKDFEDFFKNSYKTMEDKKDSDDTKKLLELTEGMTVMIEDTRVSEHFTQPPKHFTEDSLLSAMERAGSEDMDDDVERKGLGTPATRADIIEKLVKDGFVKREKKQMIPTEDGMKLITVLPDVVKSPKLTADWENELTQVSKGEVSAGQFMSGIKAMVSDLVKTYHSVSDEQKNMFGAGNTQEVFGVCPKCGGDVVKGKFGAYCKNKCGMNVSRALGVQLSDAQVKNLLAGKKILVKGLKGKKGNYDAYLIPESIEDFSYTKDGKEIKGSQYKFKMEFPHRKGKQG